MNDAETTRPDPSTRARGERTFNIFLIAACALLAVLVVLLSLQNKSLKEQLRNAQVPPTPADTLKRGDVVDSLLLRDEHGAGVELVLGEGQPTTLLLLFSPDCPACAQTLPVWVEILKDAPPSLRIAAVRLSPQTEDAPFLPFPVYTPTDGGAGFLQKIPYIPATVLVEGNRIESVWIGTLDRAARAELRKTIAAAAG